MQKWLLCGEKSYFRIRLNGIKWKSWLDKYFFVEWISCHNGVFLQSQFWILRKLINLVVAHGKGADDYLFHFLAKMCKIKSAQKEIWKEFHKSFWVNSTKHSISETCWKLRYWKVCRQYCNPCKSISKKHLLANWFKIPTYFEEKKNKLLCPILNFSSLQNRDSRHKCAPKIRLT